MCWNDTCSFLHPLSVVFWDFNFLECCAASAIWLGLVTVGFELLWNRGVVVCGDAGDRRSTEGKSGTSKRVRDVCCQFDASDTLGDCLLMICVHNTLLLEQEPKSMAAILWSSPHQYRHRRPPPPPPHVSNTCREAHVQHARSWLRRNEPCKIEWVHHVLTRQDANETMPPYTARA